MNMLERATKFAYNAHKNQLDKVGEPYFFHVERVSENCKSFIDKIVAVLHDTVEDTDVSLKDIIQNFGPIVANAVDAISKRQNESLIDYCLRVKANPIALRVKFEDIKDHLSPSRMDKLPLDVKKGLTKKYKKVLEVLNG